MSYIQSDLDAVTFQVSGIGADSPIPCNAPVFGATSLDIAGNPLAHYPDLSVQSSVRIQWPAADSWRGSAQFDVLWEDNIPRDLIGTTALLTEAHWNLDAQFGLKSENGDWRVTVWGRGLIDDLYFTQAYEVLIFGYYIVAGNFSYPRACGISATRNV